MPLDELADLRVVGDIRATAGGAEHPADVLVIGVEGQHLGVGVDALDRRQRAAAERTVDVLKRTAALGCGELVLG